MNANIVTKKKRERKCARGLFETKDIEYICERIKKQTRGIADMIIPKRDASPGLLFLSIKRTKSGNDHDEKPL